jgi:hypothetical protein
VTKKINFKVARIWDDYESSIPVDILEKYPELYGPITHMSLKNPVRNTDEPLLFFNDVSVFRPAALAFEKSRQEAKGTSLDPKYTYALEGTKAYKDFWEEERRRCLQGYEPIIDGEPCGVRITGEHYFYLNYCIIGKVVKNEMTGEDTEELGFPNFASMDYYWFKELEKSENPPEGKEKENLIVAKARRKGYQQPNSEIVMTPNGYSTMGQLKPGDKVLTPTGEATILEYYPQGLSDVYEIELYDGRKVTCGLEHLWEVYSRVGRNGERQKKVVDTEYLLKQQLKKRNAYQYYLPINEEVQYEEKELPIPAYTMGCILGDGNVSKQFKISGIDDEIFNYCLEELENYYSGGVYEIGAVYKANKQYVFACSPETKNYYKQKYGTSKFANSVNPVYEELKKLNLDCTSDKKYIPYEYKIGSVEQRYNLVRGLMDTDGSITKDGYISFSNVSKRLVLDLQEVLYSLGIVSVFRQRKDGLYILYIGTSKSVFKISRKLNRIKPEIEHRNYIPIVSIKKLDYQEESSCILIDSDNHLYLTRGYIVTHNSYKNAAGAVWKYTFFKNSRIIIGAEFGQKAKQTFDMCLNMIDFLNQNTEFRSPWTHRKSAETKCYIRSGVEVEKNGRKYTKGKKSIIETVSFSNKPDAAAGASATRILIEEAGLITNLKKAWKFTEPLLRSGKKRKGIAIAFGCVTKGTKLWTAEGKVVNVEDVKLHDQILGYNKIGASKESVSYLQEPAKKDCYYIKTDKGTELECSFDHPILASNNHSYYRFRKYLDKKTRITEKRVKKASFVRAEDLQRKDQVAVIDSVPMWGKEHLLEARFIGWLIGDGSYGFDKTPVLSTENDELFSHVKNNYEHTVERERKTKLGRIYREIRIKGITKYLRHTGIYGQTKQAKRLPIDIHKYNRKSLAELLGGLFDTDGCVFYKRDKNGHLNGYINFTTAVKELAEEVKYQLIKFGIHASVETIKSKPRDRKIQDKSIYYRVSIRESVSIKRFYRHISFRVKYKQQALSNFYRLIKKEKKIGITKSALVFRNGKEFATVLYLNGVRFETIKEIKPIGEKDIYNLTAEGTNTYLANNIITHNTGGDMSGSTQDFADMFNDPSSHMFKVYDNIYEEHDSRGKCGWFVDDMWFREGAWVEINGIRYEAVDDNGNALKWVAEIDLNQERAKIAGKDKEAYTVALSQYCKSVSEAFLITSGNVFPVAELSSRLSVLKTPEGQRLAGTNGDLVEKSGVVYFQPDLTGKKEPINRYPTPKSKKNLDGCVVQFEAPLEINGKVPSGAYIISIDPLGIDGAGEESLVAIYCLKTKRYAHLIGHDEIVMSYVGRPAVDPLDATNWILLKMAKYYNAKVTHENDRNGAAIRNFFIQQKEVGRLLRPPADIVEKHVTHSTTNLRKSGHSMGNVKLKELGEIYLKRWLLERRGLNPSNGLEELNLDKINDRGLLEELISYNRDGNFDRCVAKGSQVQTLKGKVPIEYLNIGDLVLTHTGHYKPVIKTTSTIQELTTEVYVVGQNEPLICTHDHPILISEQDKRAGNRHWKFNEKTCFKSAASLTPYRDFVFIPKEQEIKYFLTPEEEYLVGWYVGDGYLHKNRLTITFGKKEMEQAKKIADIMDKISLQHDLTPHHNTKPTATIKDMGSHILVSRNSPYIASICKTYGGVANNKKLELNSIEAAIGILEAEGSLKITPRVAVEVSMCDKHVIEKTRQILINYGIWSTQRTFKVKNYKSMYKLTIPHLYVDRLTKYTQMYKTNLRVKQMRNVAIETENGFLTPVKKVVTERKKQLFFNCEIEEHHTYVCQGFVSHNCLAFMGCVLQQEQMLLYMKDTEENEERDEAAEFFKERLLYLPSINKKYYHERVNTKVSSATKNPVF